MKNAQSEPQEPTTSFPATPETLADNLPAPAQGRQVETVTMDEMTQLVENSKGMGDVAKMEVGTINLKSEYLSFENPGESVRRVFLGFTMKQSVDPATGEDKGLLPAAQLYDPKTETVNICMQTVLVGVLFEVGYPKGAPLQITYKGDKKGKNGLKYQDFDIRALVSKK